MNTVGQANGVLQAWMDGTQVLDLHSYVFRTDPAVHVTHFDWSIFRGGGDSSWAGARDGYIDVDNLTVVGG